MRRQLKDQSAAELVLRWLGRVFLVGFWRARAALVQRAAR
jgi:hypothetical protein